MKRLFLIIGLCVSIGIASAQRQMVSKEYIKGVWEAPFSQMPGKLTYGYIINQDGENVKDGPYTIKCALINYQFKAGIYNATYNGSYTCSTVFNGGNLNGPLTSSYKLAVSSDSRIYKDESISASMSGSFVNGVPNGAFKVTRNGELITSLTANYKSGKLVGSFSCSMLDEDSRIQKYSGVLTQDGKFTGTWKFDDNIMTFSNGVLIRATYGDRSTKPAVSAMATKYAAKAISEEALFEKGYFVRTSSVKLGDFVRTAVFRDSGVDFSELRGYDFSEKNAVEYSYIEEVVKLSDAGVDKLVNCIVEQMLNNNSYPIGKLLYSYSDWNAKRYGCIFNDENNRPYVVLLRSQNKECAVGGYENNSTDHAYISEAQMNRIDSEIDARLVAQATTLGEWAVKNMDSSIAKLVKAYLEGKKEVWNDSAEYKYGHLLNDPNLDQLKQKEANVAYNRATARTLKHIEQALKQEYQKCCEKAKPHPTKSEFVILDYAASGYSIKTVYIEKASIDKISTALTKLKSEILECEKAAGHFDNMAESLVADRDKAAMAQKIMPAIKHMITWKKPFSIVWDSSSEKYFYSSTRNEFWRSDLEKRLKAFAPILDIEVVDIDERVVTLKIKQQGKKKTEVVHQIPVKHNNKGKLCVESFRIN